jgi:hypothetical protein
MDEQTEREIHELVLATIMHGRLLAQEWRNVGLVPQGCSRKLTLDLLDQLSKRTGYDEFDDDRLDLFENHICRFTNEYREGLGDRAFRQDIETEHMLDTHSIALVNLIWRWKQFRHAKLALDDKLAAIKITESSIAALT